MERTEIETLGEFGLIDHLTKNFETNNASTLLSVGDDAAVIDHFGKQTVITTDLLIEGIHFDLMYTPLKHLGYKSVIVNLSDVYAMNATPTQITMSIAFSNRFSLEALDEFYEGVYAACEKYGVDLVLCGHSHVYERSYLINKHYGYSNTFDRNTMLIDSTSGNPDSNRTYIKYTYGANKDKGTVYAVVGNSGKSEAENGKMHPVMCKKYAADGGVGSMILEVNGSQLTASYYKANGELFDKFRILKEDTTSVISGVKNNESIVNNLKVYPNPFSNTITIEFNAKESNTTSITIQNLIGQLLVETIWSGKSMVGNNKIELHHLQDLPKGEYVISIKQNQEIISSKLVKL